MKALLFLVLSLALCYHTSFAQIGGGWTNINPNTINSNPNIQDALIFGAHYSIQQGIEDGTIEKADYELINIFSARQQVVAGMNYEFVVEMASDTDYFVKLTYVVFVQSWKEKIMRVTSFEFSPLLQQNEADNNENEFDFLPEDVYETDGARRLSGSDEIDSESDDEGEMAIGGEWTPIDPSELNSDSDLQYVFNFGLKQAIRRNINNGSLPAQNYKKHKIYSIESQIVSGENYRFDVEVKGHRGVVAIIIFEVYYQSWTDTLELISSEVIIVDN